MPLMKSKSKKAFSHNVEAEMAAGKPQKQSLAIAYSVKRKAPKKKAAGGSVESGSRDMNMADGGMINAKSEKRPMPNDMHDDKIMASHNKAKKALIDDSWTDQPTVKQAQANNSRKVMPIKRPKMVPSDAFSTRLYNKEGDLEESAKPGPYGEQPPQEDNEERPDRQGPEVPALHMKKMAKGGMAGMESNLLNDEPSEDEGAMMAHDRNEMEANKHGDEVPDMEDEHSTGRKPYAKGGSVEQYEDAMDNVDHDMEMNPAYDKHSADDSEDQDFNEVDMDHSDSIASAIMARKDREKHRLSDSDMDEMIHLYEGGQIESHDDGEADIMENGKEQPNGYYPRNEDGVLKENYMDGMRHVDQPMDSNEHGDSEEADSENEHDMITHIRARIKARRQF